MRGGGGDANRGGRRRPNDEPERRSSSREWRGDDEEEEERLKEEEEEEARSEQAEGMPDCRSIVLEREQGEGQGGESRFEFRRHCEFCVPRVSITPCSFFLYFALYIVPDTSQRPPCHFSPPSPHDVPPHHTPFVREKARLLSAEYSSLPPEGVATWQRASADDRARYNREMESYVPPDASDDDVSTVVAAVAADKSRPASSKRSQKGEEGHVVIGFSFLFGTKLYSQCLFRYIPRLRCDLISCLPCAMKRTRSIRP